MGWRKRGDIGKSREGKGDKGGLGKEESKEGGKRTLSRLRLSSATRLISDNFSLIFAVSEYTDWLRVCAVDASQAGAGSLEIMVNDGAVPCQVQNLGGRQFRASFTPVDPIPHVVWMKFNGFAVPGTLTSHHARGGTH